MAGGPTGAQPAPPPMAGGGAGDAWANWTPSYGTGAVEAPPGDGGGTGSAGGQQEQWGWGSRWNWWERGSHWWNRD
eukprot:474176-Alexandrium_andersonii.AAC.1